MMMRGPTGGCCPFRVENSCAPNNDTSLHNTTHNIIRLRLNDKLTGFSLNNINIKLTAYADDAYSFPIILLYICDILVKCYIIILIRVNHWIGVVCFFNSLAM